MLENQTLLDNITEHCKQAMGNALSAVRYPLWKRECPELEGTHFVRLGLLRCLAKVDSGRHFLQNTDDFHGELIPSSTYFNALKSPRRASMLEAVEQHSYSLLCNTLRSQGIDYLRSFSELDEYTVEAADGHFIDHACHTKKGSNGHAYAAGFI